MRTRQSLKSIISSTLLTVIIAILGLIKTKVMLKYLGDDSVSLYHLYSQVFAYIALLDGGLTAGIAFFLYKPISRQKYDKINAVLTAAHKYFKKVTKWILLLGIICSFFLNFFIKQTSFSFFYIQICFLIVVITNASYYLIATRMTLYEANQELYVSGSINHFLTIIKSAIEIILSIMGLSLIWILLASLLLTILRNIVLVIMSKKRYPYLNLNYEKTDYSFKKEVKNLMAEKCGRVLFENTDIILLSKFCGPLSVVIYSAYNQLTNTVYLLARRISVAVLPSIGNLLVTEKQKAKAVFDEFQSMLFYLANIICIPLVLVISSFVNLWYGSKYVVDPFCCLCFVLILYINIISNPLEMFIKASGKFDLIKKSILYQSVVNIFLSILLLHYFGITGVLLATIIAFITGNFILYPKIVCRNVFHTPVRNYYRDSLVFIMGTICCFGIMLLFNKLLCYNNLLLLVVSGMVLFILNLLLNSLYFILIKRMNFLERGLLLVFKNKKIVRNILRILKYCGIASFLVIVLLLVIF